MANLFLDLKDEELFDSNELEISTNTTVVFGKNGTGKSTLTKLFKEQIKNFDVRVFQGFEGVIGENKRLNAVVLGEENTEINRQINKKNEEILDIRAQIKQIKDKHFAEDKLDNLWAKKRDAQKKQNDLQHEINNFYADSAAKIKNETNPQISKPTYRKNDFENELPKAQYLSEDEKKVLRQTVLTTIKKAVFLEVTDIAYEDKLKKLNDLIQYKVEPKVIIEEFQSNKDKESFAEKGLAIHDPNDKCAFCGNIISSERINRLKLFFSADETMEFKNRIEMFIWEIDVDINRIKGIQCDTRNFYPECSRLANELAIDLMQKKQYVLDFLNEVRGHADNKLKFLYETIGAVKITIPESIRKSIEEFNDLVRKNNSSDLPEQQEIAKEKLRLDKIKELADKYKIEDRKSELKEIAEKFEKYEKELLDEEDNIQKKVNKIEEIEEEIVNLRARTKNERILADEINKKLKQYVSFELVYLTDEEEQGFYQVCCNRTNERRDVEYLSTGEKNIIAFLYFIEKLNAVDEMCRLPKLVIFDDPMNSNDDTIQYVIIEELQKLIKKTNKSLNDKLVLLTHNTHFYINVSYGMKYKNNTFLRLNSNGKTVTFYRPSESDDFKTSYEVLWKELEFLFENPITQPSILLNPIRRIIETFTKFNGIDKSEMLSHVVGAQKLLNVNSHSIDDLEAELNGKEKGDIIAMMKECFEKQNASSHFEYHWKK